jgi:hypothetical protein
MKTKLATLLLLSTPAMAEECTCLQAETVTPECEKFAYTEEAQLCFDTLESEESKRIAALEVTVEEMRQRLVRRIARVESVARGAR